MGFQIFHPRHSRSGPPPLDGITVRISGGGRNRLGKAVGVLIFGIGQSQTQNLGWAKGQTVRIEVGTDKDKGLIRLSLDGHGYRLLCSAPKAKALNVHSRSLANGLTKQPSIAVLYRINGKSVTITMPDWWKAPSP